ncbi:MAG: 2-oxoacid:ferredoxin oxidoreductase subunit beta [Schwartzia sp.]|nr:2-oxoacid:ferredoxin oxidoreductase subunit beta [Schwartzia sp. (in: firmicutes)]
MEELVDFYFRPGRLPHLWCPGCGNGVVLGALLKAIDAEGLEKDDVAVISGIGCSSRASGYVDFNTANTLHGRALPISTGLKMARPDLHVITLSGDGDCSAIGGNHLIHAARRNIGLTLVVFNNSIYGMTGGQYSPLTPQGKKATTAPYLTIEPSFDILDLARAAGATFTARATTYHVPVLVDVLRKGLRHEGFSIIEAVTGCPTNFGRQNKLAAPAAMMEWQKEHGVMRAAWEKMDPAEREGKFPIGVLYERTDAVEYTKAYDKVIERAQAGKEAASA